MPTNIGLDKTKASVIAEKLNALLAHYQVLHMNVRGLHWNITGNNFFLLHEKFEEIYNDLSEKIDEIAERILTLGHVPLHTFDEYTKLSTIKSLKNVHDGTEGLRKISSSILILLDMQRVIVELAGDAGDESTVALMSDYIKAQEKACWMYQSYLA